MGEITVLVLARPNDPGLAALDRLPARIRAVVAHGADDAIPHAAAADAMLVTSGNAAVLERVWRAASRLRWIHTRPAGVDHLLFAELIESPVVMTNSRGVFSAALAEFALLGLLFFLKDVRHLLRSQAAGKWAPYEPRPLRGRTVGIVGLGDIGRAVAAQLRPAGARILGLRRSGAPDPAADEVLPGASLLDFVRRVDDLVVATPLTAQTQGLIGEAALAGLRPGAVLVNIGRGRVVDETSLLAALDQGRLRGAALDVFEQEPLPPGHPFWGMESVLVSPHAADRTAGWELDTMEVFLENARRFRDGEPLLNPVDKRLGY